MSGPPFDLDHEVSYGEVEQVSRLVQRVTAKNPSRFTFTGTGTYIVGDERVAVIDPGPADDAHVDALVAALDGRTVTHLLITHTHGDHSPAAALLQAHIDAPTFGFGPHPADQSADDADGDNRPDDGLDAFGFEPIDDNEDDAEDNDADAGYKADNAHDRDFRPDVVLAHGDRIDGDGFTFEALHTPGHISNHLCFALDQERALFSGDHVMGWSTTIIPPPDGNLNDYLDSLRLLLPRDDAVYYPTHGAPVTRPDELVPALLAHREARTDQIIGCVGQGVDTIKAIVLQLYTHVDPKLYPAAAASVMSHLVALHQVGVVTSSDGSPRPRSSYRLA